MWTFPQASHSHRFDDNLLMRTPSTRDDVERIAEFNAAIHGPNLAPMTRNLLYDFPSMEPADQVFVETNDGQIISALCLLPWTWRCENATLPVGELGIVGTDEAYRRRGLVSAQMNYFKQRLSERKCVLSIIQGIPFFYRQFGYDYALPLEGGYRLELRYTPSPVDNTPYTLRKATLDDVETLTDLYAVLVSQLCFHTVRDNDIWRYLLTRDDPADGMHHDTWLIENAKGAVHGYMRIPHYHFDDELTIDEAHVTHHAAALALIQHARQLAEQRDKPGIRLNLPANSHIVQVALAHGALEMGTYAWQIHIPDVANLVSALSPALDSRLAASPFRDWTGSLVVNFYTSALTLVFSNGRLHSVANTPPPSDAKVNIPYNAFVPLALSHRSLNELKSYFPDCNASGSEWLLLQTLFPKRPSFIHTTY